MNNSKRYWVLACAVVAMGLGLSSVARAAEPATQPSARAKAPEFALSEVRVEETAEVPFLCTSTQTNSAKLQASIDSVLPKLTRLAKN